MFDPDPVTVTELPELIVYVLAFNELSCAGCDDGGGGVTCDGLTVTETFWLFPSWLLLLKTLTVIATDCGLEAEFVSVNQKLTEFEYTVFVSLQLPLYDALIETPLGQFT